LDCKFPAEILYKIEHKIQIVRAEGKIATGDQNKPEPQVIETERPPTEAAFNGNGFLLGLVDKAQIHKNRTRSSRRALV
jgi:hypothetical protein